MPGGIAVSVALFTLLAHAGANGCLPGPGGLIAMLLCAVFLDLLVRALAGLGRSTVLGVVLSIAAMLVGQFVGHVVMAHGTVIAHGGAAGGHHHDAAIAVAHGASQSANFLQAHFVTFAEPRMLVFHVGAALLAALLLLRYEQFAARWKQFVRALLHALLLPVVPRARFSRSTHQLRHTWTAADVWSPLRGRAPPLFI